MTGSSKVAPWGWGMTKKLSIIVVAYNIENFIEQCLQSCIFAEATDYEVIVVHNASTDRTLEAIQRVVNLRPDIFKIVDNERNEGLGEGRNIGMDAATGEYVMFLDGDDWFQPDTYDRVSNLLASKNPDVLMFSYSRVWDTGGKAINPQQHLLTERDISAPEHRRAIIPSMGVAWNRAYKRSFIDRIGLRFTRRYYEDIDWNFSVILHAETYYVIPDRLVNYRQRPGSITKAVDPRHMDMLDQYRDVRSIFARHPKKSGPYIRATYLYAKGQLFNVVRAGNRLPKKLYRRFLQDAAALLKDWRREAGFSKADTQIVAAQSGLTWLFNAATEFKKTRKIFAGKLKKQFGPRLSLMRSRTFLWLYRNVLVRLPLQENKAVFESYWGRKIDCNPEAIAAALTETGKFNVVWGVDKRAKHRWPHPHTRCARNSLAYYYHLATAKYLVSNVNFSDEMIKRRDSTHVQTFHGTPIKAMGVDIRPIRPKEMNWRSFAEKCRRWDIGISSNPYSTAIWRRSHPYNYKILETGYPRNDQLANGSIDTASVRKKLGVPDRKKVALYAPTFRDDDKGKPIAVSKDVLDFEKIQAALGSDVALMVRAHHLSKIPTLPTGCIDASRHSSINEVLSIADLLITDYSSLMFDYATLKRPIVVYAYDYDKYVKSRGFYFDIREEAPGYVATSLNDLLTCLETRSYGGEENMAKLEMFHFKFCPWDDGRATDRILHQVFGVDPKPENESPAQSEQAPQYKAA
jgi:CDP-glycerol glycerophosphotransferase